MSEEIFPNLFRLEIPLPESPLKYLNSYIIKGRDRNLIVDTGLNRQECLDAMHQGLDQLGIDLARTDIFITHLHADHFGLVMRLKTDTTRIFFSRPERELIESWEGFDSMIAFAGRNGFPENQLREALDKHPGNKYGSDWMPDMTLLDDGDEIRCGDYCFECVTTPGHTMGHTCLYEPQKKILIAGDHILDDITPNIQCWSDSENPLKHYLTSLEKVRGMDVKLTLPGHRRLIEDHRARIDDLIHHHQDRLKETLGILNGGEMNAYQIAANMTWDIKCDSWEQFPVAQKWFATGEALSHLRYLEDDGKIDRKVIGQIPHFFLSD